VNYNAVFIKGISKCLSLSLLMNKLTAVQVSDTTKGEENYYCRSIKNPLCVRKGFENV
jgi:hypothetical protein